MKHNIQYLKPYRKRLRLKSTSAEVFLWNYLKNSQLLNRKFRRQHSIGNFIVDFYCHSEKLVIELDGEVHKYQIEKDALRDELLGKDGITVLRFENRLVFEDTDGVLGVIKGSFGG